MALLQETWAPPDWARDGCASLTWRPKYSRSRTGRQLWGCAVVGRSLELEGFEPGTDLPWLRELEGSTAIARSPAHPKWLVSVHLTARKVPSEALTRCSLQDVEVTTRDGSVWETMVIPHELRRLFGKETFVWGGDFNCDPRIDEGRRNGLRGEEREELSRLRRDRGTDPAPVRRRAGQPANRTARALHVRPDRCRRDDAERIAVPRGEVMAAAKPALVAVTSFAAGTRASPPLLWHLRVPRVASG